MPGNSTDFNNLIRDVSGDFQTLIENSPSFLKLLGGLNQTLDVISGAPVVTNPKHEWVNDSMSAYKSAIASFDTDGDGTGINIASTVGFIPGSIVRFESALGASKTEQCKIVSVDSSTNLTVSRDYGSTTGVTLTVGDVMILVSTPQLESSDKGDAILHQGTIDYNYTQIFDQLAQLSETSKVTGSYDKATSMARQLMAAMVRMARDIENSVIHGVRVARTNSVGGSMGGLLEYLKAAGGNIDATGGALSQTIINNIFQKITDKGGMSSNYAILVAPNQARRLTALNTSGSNPIVYKGNEVGQTLGNFVTSFIGDLPINGGLYAQVFVAQSMVKDQLAVVDLDRVKLAVMRGLQAKNATQPGSDYDAQRLLTELTLEVKNGTAAHGIATGLSL
jgi:hypothetical protein